MYQSVSTIDSPEFINLQPLEINPLMESCEIKVLYLGQNRNHSYITKDVANEMAKTLRGAPIVGYFRKDCQDFGDHGQRVIIDDEGVKFDCLTKPYGFVAPDAQVWFQKFEENDEFGRPITREYLMTTGYLWTGQFEECKNVIKNGNPQSMELDNDTLEGRWSTDNKTGVEFFIINDAIFSKLCILGNDVEPCFEGASVTAPQVSKTFSKIDNGFKNTLYSMMKDLKFVLEGGENMEDEKNLEVMDNVSESVNEENQENIEVAETETVEVVEETAEEVVTTFEDAGESSESDAPAEDAGDEGEVSTQAEEADEAEAEDEDEIATVPAKKKDYSKLEEDYTNLQTAYSALEEKYNELVSFKKTIDNEKKDSLIASFYMLSDEDKAEVIENKEKYSLEDIEAKLSVICFRKKVNFNLDDEEDKVVTEEVEEKEEVVTYSLNDTTETVPAWISAVKRTQQKNENK